MIKYIYLAYKPVEFGTLLLSMNQTYGFLLFAGDF